MFSLAVSLVFSKNGPICPSVSVYQEPKIPGVGKYEGYFYSGYCVTVKMEQKYPDANQHKDFYNGWVIGTDQLKLRMPAASWSEYKHPNQFEGKLHPGTVDAMKASRNLLITQPSKEFMDIYIKFPTPSDSETHTGIELTAEYIHEHDSDDNNTDLVMKWVPIPGDSIGDPGESFACFYVARKDIKPRDLKDRPINAGPEKSKVAKAMDEARAAAEARRRAEADAEAEANRRAHEAAEREFRRMQRNQEYQNTRPDMVDEDL